MKFERINLVLLWQLQIVGIRWRRGKDLREPNNLGNLEKTRSNFEFTFVTQSSSEICDQFNAGLKNGFGQSDQVLFVKENELSKASVTALLKRKEIFNSFSLHV